MQDRSTRDPPGHKRSETLPGHPTLLAPPLQRAGPVPDDLGPKALQTIDVAGHRMVVEVASYNGPQPLPDFGYWLVQAYRPTGYRGSVQEEKKADMTSRCRFRSNFGDLKYKS